MANRNVESLISVRFVRNRVHSQQITRSRMDVKKLERSPIRSHLILTFGSCVTLKRFRKTSAKLSEKVFF